MILVSIGVNPPSKYDKLVYIVSHYEESGGTAVQEDGFTKTVHG